jgi:F420-non-reducing hydrogenase iron-sulfur subunit
MVGFFCHWCAYRAADLMGSARTPTAPGLSVVRVLCSSRVEPEMALHALRQGADGVLVVGCRPGGCHYGDGNLRTLRRFTLLRALLPQLGIESQRVQVAWASASEASALSKAIERMARELRALGPLRRAPATFEDDVAPPNDRVARGL